MSEHERQLLESLEQIGKRMSPPRPWLIAAVGLGFTAVGAALSVASSYGSMQARINVLEIDRRDDKVEYRQFETRMSDEQNQRMQLVQKFMAQVDALTNRVENIEARRRR